MKAVPHQVVIETTHSMAYLDLRHDWFRFCAFVTICSVLVNFLPRSTMFDRWPTFQWWYGWLIDWMALCACNWRRCLPSLDLPLFFKAETEPPRHPWKPRKLRRLGRTSRER